MKTALQILIITTTFLFSLTSTAQVPMNTFWADTLNKSLAQWRTNENMQALAASVVFPDGTVWSEALGNHGYDPLTVNDLYDMGSNTKSMIAAVMLLLEEEGALSLDDTLYSYISPVPNVLPGITLEQLLNHRSGVADFTIHPDFYYEIELDEDKFWHPDSVLANFVGDPLFTPGNGFEYSNSGYLLLGKVIEVIENEPLNVVLRKRILDPLGLDNIYMDQYDSYSQVKTGSWLNPTWYYLNIPAFMSAAWASGAMVATPEDFALYAHKFLRGDLLSQASMDKLIANTTSISLSREYGLGVMAKRYKGRDYLGHGGTTLQNSEMEYSIESDFSMVLMNLDNGFGTETGRTRSKMLDLLEYIVDVHDSVSAPIEEEDNSVGFENGPDAGVEMEVYPNPSVGYMTFRTTHRQANNLRLEVYDLMGRTVYQGRFESNSLILSRDQIGSGAYVARLMDDQGMVQTKHIIFQ